MSWLDELFRVALAGNWNQDVTNIEFNRRGCVGGVLLDAEIKVFDLRLV